MRSGTDVADTVPVAMVARQKPCGAVAQPRHAALVSDLAGFGAHAGWLVTGDGRSCPPKWLLVRIRGKPWRISRGHCRRCRRSFTQAGASAWLRDRFLAHDGLRVISQATTPGQLNSEAGRG